MKTGDKAVGVFFAAIITIASFCIAAAGLNRWRRDWIKEESYAETTYPFPESQQEQQDRSVAAVVAKYYDAILTAEAKIKNYSSNMFVFQPSCLLTKKMIDKTLGIDMTTSLCGIQNDVTTDADVVTVYSGDSLAFLADDVDISDLLGNLIDFGQQMRAEGRDFLLFLAPGKFAGNEAFTDFSQSRNALIVDSLQAAGLDVYDVGRMFGDTPQQRAPFFFKTDHHWLPTTGLLACRYMGEYLNENYDYEIDTSLFDLENYEIEALRGNYLGSQGSKVSEAYASVEDFPIVTPKYESDLDVFIADKNKSLHGSVTETLLDFSALKGDTGGDSGFYGYGNRDLITIHNNSVHNGKHMLWIKESMADYMYPYFANAVEYLDVIDLRVFAGSLQTFIEKTDPDTVVMVYGIMSFNEDEGSNGQTENAFDFR